MTFIVAEKRMQFVSCRQVNSLEQKTIMLTRKFISKFVPRASLTDFSELSLNTTYLYSSYPVSILNGLV